MSFGGGGARGKYKSEINVTPLVDVVLVLLIIFLVVMPIQMKEITLDIPKQTEPDVEIDVPTDQLIVFARGDGTVVFNPGAGTEEVVQRVDLATALHKKMELILDATKRVVFVDFADNVPWGDAVSIMDTVKGSGAKTLGLKMKVAATPVTPAPPQ